MYCVEEMPTLSSCFRFKAMISLISRSTKVFFISFLCHFFLQYKSYFMYENQSISSHRIWRHVLHECTRWSLCLGQKFLQENRSRWKMAFHNLNLYTIIVFGRCWTLCDLDNFWLLIRKFKNSSVYWHIRDEQHVLPYQAASILFTIKSNVLDLKINKHLFPSIRQMIRFSNEFTSFFLIQRK